MYNLFENVKYSSAITNLFSSRRDKYNKRKNCNNNSSNSSWKISKGEMDIKITYLGSRLKICRFINDEKTSSFGKNQQQENILVWQKI